METKKLTLLIKAAALLIVVISLSTCNTSKKATSQAESFKIPKKIINAEDLPQPVQKKEIAEVRYVQLFPDEKTEVESQPVAQETKPVESQTTISAQPSVNQPVTETKEILMASDELEKHVEDVISQIVKNKKRPMYYHIVSGSFRNKILADRFAEHLKNIGYGNTYVQFFDNGFNRVIVQRYNNEVEARQYLQGYRIDNPSYADAWLYYNINELNNEPLAFATK
jgi:hypothetical protein